MTRLRLSRDGYALGDGRRGRRASGDGGWPPAARAGAIRALAGLVRAGMPARAALAAWHLHAPRELSEDLGRASRRLRLGDSVQGALDALGACLGSDGSTLQSALGIHAEAGGDLARMLDGIALSIENRSALASAGRAAGSGALLSGRLVAALPLACLPLLPVSRAPLLDFQGVVLAAAGLCLAAAGVTWITRLTPRPPSEDPGAAVADALACVLSGGASLRAGLDAAARHPPAPVAQPMRRAARMVALGTTWIRALEASGAEPLTELAAALRLGHDMGLPVAATLDAFARSRRAAAASAFDAATKRAPVLMVIPLAVCVLPSFLLLGLAPFLRSLAV